MKMVQSDTEQSASGLRSPDTEAAAAPDYDMSIHTNPDARAWAAFFMKCNPASNVPEDLMVTWFANAMMAMHDHMRPDLAPVVLPDGSASCPA